MVKNINVDFISSIYVKVKCKDDLNVYLLQNFKYVFFFWYFVFEKKNNNKNCRGFLINYFFL